MASCVVFDVNGPVKADYRRFNIRDIAPGDDYAAMLQALDRRFARLAKGEEGGMGKVPDILLMSTVVWNRLTPQEQRWLQAAMLFYASRSDATSCWQLSPASLAGARLAIDTRTCGWFPQKGCFYDLLSSRNRRGSGSKMT